MTRSACSGPSQGHWKLWVHIADVSHYVKPGTALDEEAAKRGNSTYLVDRVVPMLPEALSNELCSLKPQVERLTKCVEFLLSAEGQVLKTQFYPAVILSQRRYTYKEVFALLQRRPLDPIEQMLHEANALTQKVRRTRFKAGSLDLDFPETKIRLDERGRVLRMEKVENDVSHQLIEECMLLANEAVAARLMSLNRPAIYRIHEPPDDRRLQEYREDVLSHHIQCGNLSNRHEVQKLLEKLKSLAHRPGAEDWFPAVAHAGALRGRTARPLRAGEEEIHPFHVANPALRGPRGASRPVPAAGTAGDGSFSQGGRSNIFPRPSVTLMTRSATAGM